MQQLSAERRAVVNAVLASPEPLSTREIANRVPSSYDSVRQMLGPLTKAGHIRRVKRGLYSQPDSDHVREPAPAYGEANPDNADGVFRPLASVGGGSSPEPPITAYRAREVFGRPDLHFVVELADNEPRYVRVGGTRKDLLGNMDLSEESIIGRTVREVITDAMGEGAAEAVNTNFRRAINGETIEFDSQSALGDHHGIVRPVRGIPGLQAELLFYPMAQTRPESEVTHVAIVNFDITAGAGSAEGVVVSEQPLGTYIIDPREMQELVDIGPPVRRPIAFRMMGESMEPTLRDGDHLVIEPYDPGTKRIKAGGIYVFRLEDAVEVKQLERMPGNQLQVTPRNSNYTAYTLDLSVADVDFEVIGRVRGWFKRS